MSLLYFEDYAPGEIRRFGSYAVTKEEIFAFARAYDPQPFHLDEAAAARSLLGGLAASGWHTLSMMMRLYCDEWVLRSASMGSPGIEEARWTKPVRPGDSLSVRMRVLDSRVSKSRPEMGLITIASDVINQMDETVASVRHVNLLGRRGTDWARPAAASAAPKAAAAPVDEGDGRSAFGWFEDVVLERPLTLGAYEFREEEMIAFARAYDPQPFHIDPTAAARSPFGRLIASGWHTAAGFMRRLVETRGKAESAARTRGEQPPAAGPSPGFRDLRWLSPVYSGDRLVFTSTAIEKRAAARPGWGLVFAQNLGAKDNGEIAFSFRSAAFYPLRDPP